jgi:hypothetical protein
LPAPGDEGHTALLLTSHHSTAAALMIPTAKSRCTAVIGLRNLHIHRFTSTYAAIRPAVLCCSPLPVQVVPPHVLPAVCDVAGAATDLQHGTQHKRSVLSTTSLGSAHYRSNMCTCVSIASSNILCLLRHAVAE